MKPVDHDIDYNIGRFNSPACFVLPETKDDIKIYRLNTEYRRNKEKKYIFLSVVSTQKFYNKVWAKAIKAKKVKLFKVKSSFSIEKAEKVLNELQDILTWCKDTYGEKSFEYYCISKAISKMEIVIKKEDRKSKLYIF